MAISNRDAIQMLRDSRQKFWRHVEGMTPDQREYKPYSEVKSVRETLGHLILDDLAALESLETQEEPNYGTITETHWDRLVEMLTESHLALLAYLEANVADLPTDTPVTVWGTKMPAALGIAYLTSEDFYHCGQVAAIRIALDPGWDYYGHIYR